MVHLERGHIQAGGIVLDRKLELPEGTEVVVHIQIAAPPASGDITALPAIGMWADRDDLADSANWVRQEREQWQRRFPRPD